MSNATGRPATLRRDPQHHMRPEVSTGSPATAPRYGQPYPPPGPGTMSGSSSLTSPADRANGGSFGGFGGSGTGGGAAF